MKPIDVNSSVYIDFDKENNQESLKFKVVEYQNIKTFSQKVMLQIGQQKCLSLKKLRTLSRGHVFLLILREKKFLECFTKKKCKKTNQNKFRVEKVIKRNSDKLCVKWKGYDYSF